MKQIPLRARDGSVRAWATVDEADHDALSRFSWHLTEGYAMRMTKRVDGRQRKVPMHRQILRLELGDPHEVDHINRDRLDNRRANLRTLTRAQNRQNRPSQRGSRSRYRGVTWNPAARRWEASVWSGPHRKYLGVYSDEDEAGRAASSYRNQHMPFSVEQTEAA